MYPKFIILFAVLFLASICKDAQAKTHAVVGSGGNSTTDDIFNNSEWWTDLYGAYETLLNHGLQHSQITVCYGEGQDFVSKYDRFRNRWQNEIPQITDYNNHKATIQHVLDSLKDVVTASDTLLFWWVIGHGDATSMNDYSFLIQNEGTEITEAEFAGYVNVIANYAFRMFIWCTCTSGGIRDNLSNNKSVVITCCDYNQYHYPSHYGASPFTNVVTAEFPKLVRPYLNAHDMFGNASNADRDTGAAHNNRIDFTELRDSITAHYVDSWGNTVCLGDSGSLASISYPANNDWSQCLEFKYNGNCLARLSNSGYMQVKGVGRIGQASGLVFKNSSEFSLTADGDVVRDSAIDYSFTWLDTTSNLVNSLVFRNCNGTNPVAGFQSTGVVRLRGWEAPGYPRFNH